MNNHEAGQEEVKTKKLYQWEFVHLGFGENHTPQSITDFFKKFIPDFKGNVERASELISRMKKAEDWVVEHSSPIGAKAFKNSPPHIGVVTRWPADDDFAALAEPESNMIGYRQVELEILSEIDPNATVTLVDSSNEPVFIGTTGRIAELTAVEETRHIYFAQNIDPSEGYKRGTTREHDSEPIEIDGLEWQIKYAEAHSFPKEEVDVLRTRLQIAKSD